MRLFVMAVTVVLWISLGVFCAWAGWIDALDQRIQVGPVPGGTIILVVYLVMLLVMVVRFLRVALWEQS